MLAQTPKKYANLKNDDVRKSFQGIIDNLIEFKIQYPEATKQDLNVYAKGILKGRTKTPSFLRT